jgi:hypothetical protein
VKRLIIVLALLLLPCMASAQQVDMWCWIDNGPPIHWAPCSTTTPLPVSIGGSSGGVAVFGPTASGSASANPPVQIGGTATGAAGQNVAGAAVKPASTAAVATDTSVVTQLNPNSPGIIANAAPGTPNTATVISVQGETGMTPIQTSPSAATTGGATYTHIAAGTATTVIKASAGTLYAINFNSAATATNTTNVYDNASGAGTVIATPAATTVTLPISMAFGPAGVAFANGLTIITATANGSDMTVVWK